MNDPYTKIKNLRPLRPLHSRHFAVPQKMSWQSFRRPHQTWERIGEVTTSARAYRMLNEIEAKKV